LEKLRQAGLTVNQKKCEWGQTQCEFLGHVVGQGEVMPAKCKVEAMQNFVRPKTKKNIRQFLGLTGYYRKFIADYASHTYHLTEATRKHAPECIVWSDELNFCFLKIVSVLFLLSLSLYPQIASFYRQMPPRLE